MLKPFSRVSRRNEKGKIVFLNGRKLLIHILAKLISIDKKQAGRLFSVLSELETVIMESELIFQYLLAAFIYPVLSKKTDENSRNRRSAAYADGFRIQSAAPREGDAED